VQVGIKKLNAPSPTIRLFDPNTTRNYAAYNFNEFQLTDTLRAQLSARVDRARAERHYAQLSG